MVEGELGGQGGDGGRIEIAFCCILKCAPVYLLIREIAAIIFRSCNNVF